MEKLVYPQPSYPTNLKGINTNAVSPPNTDRFFNNYFNFPVEFNSSVDSAIIAFFETISDNKQSARELASAVLYTALKQGMNPMSVLDEFKKLPPGELNTYTALFLNTERVGTSFLGLKNKPVQNKYVTRAILP